jgi:hypothetical protein
VIAGGEPDHIATDQNDLSADLRRGLAYLKTRKKSEGSVNWES